MEKDYLIKKWLANELSPEEQKAFSALPDASFYKEITHEATRFKAESQVKAPAFETLAQNIEDKKEGTRILTLKNLVRVAAVAALVFGVYFIGLRDKITTVQTDLAQLETIVLPDNSTVVVNENSSISYHSKNWDRNRNIELTGEAFFDVEKGKTFKVTTASGSVTVLGTEFNVRTTNNALEVICYEGKVQVTRDKQEVILTPGEGVLLSVNGKKEMEIAVTQPQWKQQMSVFTKTSLDLVFKEFSKQYGVPVQTTAIDTTLLFSGAFTYDHMEDALKAITTPFNLTYTIQPDLIIISPLDQ